MGGIEDEKDIVRVIGCAVYIDHASGRERRMEIEGEGG